MISVPYYIDNGNIAGKWCPEIMIWEAILSWKPKYSVESIFLYERNEGFIEKKYAFKEYNKLKGQEKSTNAM